MKNIIKLSLITLLSISNVYAMKEENIINDIKTKVNIITNTVTANNTDNNKKEIIFNNLKEVIDFELFYKLSLGKNYDKFNDQDLIKFKTSFEQNLKNFYFDKFKSYNNQKFIFVEELKKGENNRLILESSILDEKSGNKYKIDYKVYFNKDKQEWFVYDILVEEVSILKTYIAQFNEILSSGNTNDLIAKLDTKNLEIKK